MAPAPNPESRKPAKHGHGGAKAPTTAAAQAKGSENTIMKIAGWKTPSMFRRYDIQDGKDIQRAGKTMERWIAARKVTSAADSSDQSSALDASKSKQVN